MKTLTVQIREGLAAGFDAEQAVGRLVALVGQQLPAADADATRAEVSRSEGCVNVNFRTPDLTGLWHAIQGELGLAEVSKPPIADALIVVCEGQYGWDDYRLLHHFDDFETLDRK